MSAIAQRRVAGATALMILLYLLQVALFAAPAQAAVEFVKSVDQPGSTCDQEPGFTKVDSNTGSTGDLLWGSAEGTGTSVEVDLNAGYSVYICTKQGPGYQIWHVTYDPQDEVQTVAFDPNLSQNDPGLGLSHWGWMVGNTPDTPEITIGLCDDEGLRPVSFTVQPGFEMAIWEKDTNVVVGSYLGGAHTVDLAPGDYSWIFYQLIGEDKTQLDQGSFTVDPCDTTTSSTSSTSTSSTSSTSTTSTSSTSTTSTSSTSTTSTSSTSTTSTTSTTLPPPPPPPGSTAVNFSAACDDAGNYVASFSLPNASGRLDINGDGVFDAGEVGLGSGQYVLTGSSYSWDAAANAGFVLTGVASGQGVVDDCTEVLGTTITTVPEVSADTLPFTGSESGEMAKLAVLALVAGGLMLFAVRGRDDEEEAAIETGGWSSL